MHSIPQILSSLIDNGKERLKGLNINEKSIKRVLIAAEQILEFLERF
ncbi:hypothetical protein [Sulfurisphaera ohwakuensis]|uniref:Uncharacterized protein n=1 Tax=Sulfurisphaera ohwakuensis TaxID=69656 RepID=A0A7J9RV14_SULOH|nr:hypothetical protein [Sulfurisphaera ohwakuensis]MBB5254837.1 hypothetical protein [Sulfurisphaera ohwakuensis]